MELTITFKIDLNPSEFTFKTKNHHVQETFLNFSKRTNTIEIVNIHRLSQDHDLLSSPLHAEIRC